MADVDFKTLEARCHCGSVHFTLEVPVKLLPAYTHLCHCSLCRYSTGAPCTIHSFFDPSVQPNWQTPSSSTSLTYYKVASGSYLFCSTCGAHVGAYSHRDNNWTYSTSIFTESGPELFQFKRHIYSKSAVGGGLCNILKHIGGAPLIEWNPPDNSPSAQVIESQPETGPDGVERLRAQCHCGGVTFTISRPRSSSTEPDSTLSAFAPPDAQKWAALWDVCNDCRLSNGVHVIGWASVPASSCEPPIPEDLVLGSNRTYASSQGTTRSFCGTCGATVFFSCDARHVSADEHVVDVATGILRAPEGVMAERWLYWRTKVAWLEDGESYDAPFAGELQRGVK